MILFLRKPISFVLYIFFYFTAGILSFSYAENIVSHSADEPKEIVFLVHGLGRTKKAMRTIAKDLSTKPQYQVVSLEYPWRDGSLDYQVYTLTKSLEPYLKNPNITKYHFVGHSLGGLLSWVLWQGIPAQQQGQLIFLGSPLKGSPWLTPGFIRSEILQPFYGRILLDLIDVSVFIKRHHLDFESSNKKLEVAGNVCPWYSNVIGFVHGVNQPHDCFVTTESALAYASDRKILCPVDHQGLLESPCSLEAISDWLDNSDSTDAIAPA